jgi:predicted RNA-binding protein with PUA-like domain
MRSWLMKTEGNAYSIDDLKRDGVTPWEGVRNFQARNFMREMEVGDQVLFYHSGTLPGVYGLAIVAHLAHPDMTQFDPKSPYFDRRATAEKPYWFCVDVRFVKKFKRPVLLRELRADKKFLGMRLLEPGSRLSVMPVASEHAARVASLAA